MALSEAGVAVERLRDWRVVDEGEDRGRVAAAIGGGGDGIGDGVQFVLPRMMMMLAGAVAVGTIAQRAAE